MGARMLLFSSLFLIALPWLGYRYLDEMKEFLVQGQEDAQLLTARAVATVLHGREELFYAIDETADIAEQTGALHVYPLDGPIEMDGYTGDWDELKQQARRFNDQNRVYERGGGTGQPVSFNLLLGEYGKSVYALVRVSDSNIVYRNPRYRRLDHSDHVRIELITADGESRRLLLITEGEGQVSVYDMRTDWKIAVNGKPVYALTGVWRERSDGYDLEIRIPASWFGPQPRMMISVADVSDPVERMIDGIVSTLRKEAAGKPSLLIRRSAELDRIVMGLGSAETGICVVDRYRRVRGVYGRSDEAELCAQKETVSGDFIIDALNGDQSVMRYQDPAGESVVVAAYPVNAGEDVIGAVIVEKNSSHILGLQRKSLVRIAITSFMVFLAAIFSLMLFAAWLAYRIRKLQKEASQAIDADGRIISGHLETGQYAVDEIGQLSRDFSTMLARLKSYTGFLESVPRTLRHEILNPVNTISMSLQKLDAGTANESILNSARKATQQLEMIVHGLTEAAHIEDALMQDEYERFDVAAMVNEYVANSKLRHGDSRFRYLGPDSGLYIKGSDLRIAQLLDKLKDNALDFSDDRSEILFELQLQQDKLQLSVVNEGADIPEEVLDKLFAGMISSRPVKDDKPHLGIGLFIANCIARQHQGELKIMNLDNSAGVRVSLFLPATG